MGIEVRTALSVVSLPALDSIFLLILSRRGCRCTFLNGSSCETYVCQYTFIPVSSRHALDVKWERCAVRSRCKTIRTRTEAEKNTRRLNTTRWAVCELKKRDVVTTSLIKWLEIIRLGYTHAEIWMQHERRPRREQTSRVRKCHNAVSELDKCTSTPNYKLQVHRAS